MELLEIRWYKVMQPGPIRAWGGIAERPCGGRRYHYRKWCSMIGSSTMIGSSLWRLVWTSDMPNWHINNSDFQLLISGWWSPAVCFFLLPEAGKQDACQHEKCKVAPGDNGAWNDKCIYITVSNLFGACFCHFNSLIQRLRHRTGCWMAKRWCLLRAWCSRGRLCNHITS